EPRLDVDRDLVREHIPRLGNNRPKYRIVIEAVAAADGRPSVRPGIPGKPKVRSEIVAIRFIDLGAPAENATISRDSLIERVRPSRRICRRGAGRRKTGEPQRLLYSVIGLVRNCRILIAKAIIKSQVLSGAPVVIEEEVVFSESQRYRRIRLSKS